MSKDKNYYKILGEGRPCNLLKTSQLNPVETHFATVSAALSKLDGCILYRGNIFYVNQQKKTCRLVAKKSDDPSYHSLYQAMNQLEDDHLTNATSSHLTYITEVTEHSLPIDASKEEITKAYKILALIYHPDRNRTNNTAKFQEIVNAYEHLYDETKRKIYDENSRHAPFDFQEFYQEMNRINKMTFENLLTPFDLRYQKSHPEEYKQYTDPEADFTQEDKNSTAYQLRDRLYAPDGDHIRSLNRVENNQFRSNSITSQRTLKSYQKHFEQRFFTTTYSAFSKEEENHLKLPKKEALYFRVINGEFAASEYAYLIEEKIKKYISTTFLPYQDIDQIYNTLLQPFNGLKYLFIGLFFIIVTIVTYPFLIYCAISTKKFSEFKHPLFLPGLKFLVIGLGLLLTTPLTWLVQMPIRAVFNLLRQGWGHIEDGYHIQRIIAEAEKAIALGNKQDCITTTALLHKKFNLNLIHKHRVTDINSNDEKEQYELLDKDFVLGTLHVCSEAPITCMQKTHLLSYLSLFKTTQGHEPNLSPTTTHTQQIKR